MLPTGGIRLFRVFGITVFLHTSWFIVAFIELQWRQSEYHNWSWNVAEYLSLFGIVLLHEFGHALACRSVGGKADKIVLWPFGGVAFVSPPPRPGAVLWSIAAGPLVNVAILIATFSLFDIDPDTDWHRFLSNFATINFGLLLFNILPIYPLDGGQMLQSLLWFIFGRVQSLLIASVIGIVGAFGLFVSVAWHAAWHRHEILDYLFPAAIILWLGFMAWNGFRRTLAMKRMDQLPRRPQFHCPSCGKSPIVGALWRCSRCGNPFDTFDRGAVCPRCGHFHNITICPECGVTSPMAAWQQNPQGTPGFYNSPPAVQMPFIPPLPPPGAPEIRLPNSGNPTG